MNDRHLCYHAIVQCMVAFARAQEKGRAFCVYRPKAAGR